MQGLDAGASCGLATRPVRSDMGYVKGIATAWATAKDEVLHGLQECDDRRA